MARSDNNLKAVLEDTANAIRSKTGGSSLIIPRDFADTIGGIEIPDLAPYYSNTVVNAVVPDSIITNMRNGMFENNIYLESIDFNNATIIPSYCCSGCSNLQNIVFNSNTTKIDDYAFSENSRLIDIDLPKNITYVGQNSFYEVGLFYGTSPKSFTFITNDNFKTNIVGQSFQNSALSKLKITTTNIGGSSFSNCRKLTEVEIIGDNCVLGYSCFANCQNISKFKISGSFSYLDSYIFDSLAYNTYATAQIEPFDFSSSTFTTLLNGIWASCRFDGIIKFPATLTTVGGSFLGGATGNWKTYWLSVPNVSNYQYIRDDYGTDFIVKYIFLYTLLDTANVATNWTNHTSQMLGWGTFQANDTLPTTQGTLTLTWYDSVDLTNQVSVASADGDYYCTFA